MCIFFHLNKKIRENMSYQRFFRTLAKYVLLQQLLNVCFVNPEKVYMRHITLCFTQIQVKALCIGRDRYIKLLGWCLKKRRAFNACMNYI